MTENDPVLHCEGCGKLIGAVVNRNGRSGLMISLCETGMVVYRLHGWCECGHQVHWDSGEIRLRRLVKMVQDGRVG